MTTPHPAPGGQHSGAWKWWVCAAIGLATFLNYMDRQALAVTLPELKATYQLNERRIGLIEGCFGFAFAAGSLSFGLLADRYGPRRLYPIVLCGWSVAGIATAFAGDGRLTALLESTGDDPGAGTFRWLLACRTVLGLFEAGHWPCALITAQRLLTAADRPLGNGILQSGAAVASILIPLYAELIETRGGGWQVVFWSVGAGGLLWVPLWLVLVRRHDLDLPPRPATPAAPGVPTADIPRSLFVRRLLVLVTLTSCLTVSWQFLRAWLPLFLQDFHGYSRADTRYVTVAYFVAAEVGCLLVGVVVKVLAGRGLSVHAARVGAFAGYTALALAAAAIPLLGTGALMVVALMVAGAGILGLHPLYYSLGQEMSRRRMGTLSGSVTFCGWCVSSVFQILIGARIEATKSYDTGLVIAGLAPVLALVVLVVLWKPTPTPK